MPEVNVTPALRDTIKHYRKKIHLRGDSLSRTLQKNTSFISQLETGKIETIDTNLLYKIFDEIFQNDSPEDRSKKTDKILSQLQISLSDKELERQRWMIVMDLQYRLIPIPESVIKYIKDKLTELDITAEELINHVNQNKSLYENYSSEEIQNMEDNKVYPLFDKQRRGMYIKFNLPTSYISDIFSGKIIRCNFVTLQTLIYNIYLLEGLSYEKAIQESEDYLFKNKFYTLLQKQHLPLNSDKLASYDIDFEKKLQRLKNQLSAINDRQPDFLNELLDILYNNIKEDPSLTFSLLRRDLTTLSKLSINNKKNFMKDFDSLISEYIKNSISDSEKIETF